MGENGDKGRLNKERERKRKRERKNEKKKTTLFSV